MNDRTPASESTISQIDFSKYRTPELIATIAELLSLGGKIRQVVGWTVLGCIALVIAVGVVFAPRVPIGITVALLVYAVPIGLASGLFLGIAEMIRRSASGVLAIVDLLLLETAIIANDMQDIRGGGKLFPMPGVLVSSVYKHLILPIAEDVIRSQLGFLGRPVLWFYRSTLDRAVQLVIRRFVPESYEDIPDRFDEIPESDPDMKVIKGVAVAADAIADNEDRITAGLNWTRSRVASAGYWLKLLIVGPCYGLFALVFTVFVALPLALVFYIFAMGEDAEAVAALGNWLHGL